MKLLVVEDDLTLSTMICFELDCNDYLTVAAYNCKKAYQLIQSDHFDLVILDVNLPDGNGFDLCRTIKKVYRRYRLYFCRPMIWNRIFWMVLISAQRIMSQNRSI